MIYPKIIILYFNQKLNILSLTRELLEKCNIIIVCNNPKSLHYNGDNSLFEFSGYRKALNNDLIKNNSKVLILNDTFFFSHLFIINFVLLFFFWFKLLFHNHPESYIGIKNIIRYKGTDFTYLSTWLFGLYISDKKMFLKLFDEFSNYDKDNILNEYIHRWLIPHKIFKGWYKSSFLNINSFNRKINTINFEFKFLKQINSLNYSEIVYNNLFSSILLFIDRIYVNFLKIMYKLVF